MMYFDCFSILFGDLNVLQAILGKHSFEKQHAHLKLHEIE